MREDGGHPRAFRDTVVSVGRGVVPHGGSNGRTAKCGVPVPQPWVAPFTSGGPWFWSRMRTEGIRDEEVGGHRGALVLGRAELGEGLGAGDASCLTDPSPFLGATAKIKVGSLLASRLKGRWGRGLYSLTLLCPLTGYIPFGTPIVSITFKGFSFLKYFLMYSFTSPFINI